MGVEMRKHYCRNWFTSIIACLSSLRSTSWHLPELIEITDTSNIVMRGGSIALLALLESSDIDYAFEYESVARQHGLEYVELLS